MKDVKNLGKKSIYLSDPSFKMGKTFLQHPGGARLYSCAKCDTVLTNKSQLISMVSRFFCDVDMTFVCENFDLVFDLLSFLPL